MIQLSQLTDMQVMVFGLLLLRMASFVTTSAIFGSPIISPHLKVLFALTFAMGVYPPLNWKNILINVIEQDLIAFAAREVLIGILMGFLTRMFFFTVNMVGDLVSVFIGLNTAQLYNPLVGSQGNTMDQIYTGLGTLLFLSLQGHHVLLSGLAQSVEILPIAGPSLHLHVLSDLVLSTQMIFISVIKMCAPVLVTVFLVNLSMGILGRAVPQVNVLVTSMPITIMLGLLVVIVSLPLMIGEMSDLVNLSGENLFRLMRQL